LDWLSSVGLGALDEAACLTFVNGSGPAEILAAVGADVEQPALTLDQAHEEAAACVGVAAWGSGFVAVEANGGEGARGSVLRRLSQSGRAASLYWNVNAMVVLSCASRGRMRGSEGLLALHGGTDLPKSVLTPCSPRGTPMMI
jgi:hypothetical protein